MDRWHQIEWLFQEALQRDSADRQAWLREACHGDAELQREVASLLANHHEVSDFGPWPAAAAAQLIEGSVSIKAGQRLGPYEILGPIGKGGMGDVYKARDTRLKRDVAIKICAAQFSERFEREARVIASLNHPNICQLHDVGPNFLVMELVEGENLAGPLPVETALNYARQIAEALEAAHEKGIVHRDLKPANVKVTPAGLVKVLDFGLAMVAQASACDSGDPSVSPTLTISPTRAGVILGTAPYMSPEQARGAAVDKRADIWAFGCVLYEMLTGKQAFHGETISDILAAVLKEEPDWSRIPAMAQPLLRRCMAKDTKQRLRDIGDAIPLLDAVPEQAPARRPWAWIAIAAVLTIAAAMGWWRATHPAPLPPPPLVRVSVDLSPGTTVSRIACCQLALSSDGTRIAIIQQEADGKSRLATRRLDQSQFAPVYGTEGADRPFFSPDGQWIGFVADGKLKKIAVQGGSAVALCDAPRFRSASWGDDGNIVAAFAKEGGRLWRVPSGGGTLTPATELSREKGDSSHQYPQVLPGSQAVLLTANRRGTFEDAEIDVISFKTGERKTLVRGGFWGRYLPSGHLVYLHQGTLFAAPFDISRLAVTGSPQPVLEDVSSIGGRGIASFDLSQTGTFIYLSGRAEPPSMFWLDGEGKTRPLHLTPGFNESPRFSPDGKRLAFIRYNDKGTDIWVQDLEREIPSRLTSLPGFNAEPVWTPDSQSIVFESSATPAPGLYWIQADGSGGARRLLDVQVSPYSFTPDGRRLAYDQFQVDGRREIWTVPVEGDPQNPRLGKSEPFEHTPFYVMRPAFSPNGHWLAYTSDETGIQEVYVRPFPGPGEKRQISSGGGLYPIWSQNNRQLFFLSYSDWRIMAAEYTVKGDSFVAGKPQVWFDKALAAVRGAPYDLAPDSKRFAVVLYAGGGPEQAQKPTDSVTVLLNFFDELRRSVPVAGK